MADIADGEPARPAGGDLHWADGFPLLAWRAARPWLAVSSAVAGGGIGLRHWLLNATVRSGYDRADPAEHVAELAGALGLRGPGIGLLTAVDVRRAVRVVDGPVTAVVTTGVGAPIWAAEPEPAGAAEPVGTINIVCRLRVRMSEPALVNLVATATEAKAQALAEAGVAGTGTCTDAVAVLCAPDGEPRAYGGPRSDIGAPLARAVHAAVRSGLADGAADGTAGRFLA